MDQPRFLEVERAIPRLPAGFARPWFRHMFVEDDGAKYRIERGNGGGRFVSARLRKRKYMHGEALANLRRMEKWLAGGSEADVESSLRGRKFLTERIAIENLSGRIEEIIAGERPKRRGTTGERSR